LFALRATCKGLRYNARAVEAVSARCKRAEVVAALKLKRGAHAAAASRHSAALSAAAAASASAEAALRCFTTWFGRSVAAVARMHARGRLSLANKLARLAELEKRRDSAVRAKRGARLADARAKAATALREERRAWTRAHARLAKVEAMLAALNARTAAGQ